jgi:hypothetical protein
VSAGVFHERRYTAKDFCGNLLRNIVSKCRYEQLVAGFRTVANIELKDGNVGDQPRKKKTGRKDRHDKANDLSKVENVDKEKEQVQSKSIDQSDEAAINYWTPERRAAAVPLPLPTIEPPSHPSAPQPKNRATSNEIVSEPQGPDPHPDRSS